MKTAVVSYKVDASSKPMMQHKRKPAIENDWPKKKSRKYTNSYKCNNSYVDVGFTFILQNGEEKPQCVVCSKVLVSESMLPNKI